LLQDIRNARHIHQAGFDLNVRRPEVAIAIFCADFSELPQYGEKGFGHYPATRGNCQWYGGNLTWHMILSRNPALAESRERRIFCSLCPDMVHVLRHIG
jgi:hypothetical protein